MDTQEANARKSFFKEPIYPGSYWRYHPVVFAALYLVSAALVHWWRPTNDTQAGSAHKPLELPQTLALLLIGLWILGPPLWFTSLSG